MALDAIQDAAHALHEYIRAEPGNRINAAQALSRTEDGELIRGVFPSKPVVRLVGFFPALFRLESHELIALGGPSETHGVAPLHAQGEKYVKAAAPPRWEVHGQVPGHAEDDEDDEDDTKDLDGDESLYAMLPEEIEFYVKRCIRPEDRMRIRDIKIDVGKPVYCVLAGVSKRERVDVLGVKRSDKGRYVSYGKLMGTVDMIKYILKDLPAPGHDNRTGPANGLHRVSVLSTGDKSNPWFGLTLRVARVATSGLHMVRDLIDDPSMGSILVLGPPDSGKTTLIRAIVRQLAETEEVIIVDTSKEIGGNTRGAPLEILGRARRVMVPHREHQEDAMIEALQNHAPDTIVVDEIGRKREVEAAATIRERSVRVVASAHGGSLENLINNKDLAGLVGGVETVMLGDYEARKAHAGPRTAELQKVKRVRARKPVFDILIIMDPRPGAPLQVIRNVAKAVDDVLRQRPYEVELRAIAKAGEPFVPVQLTSASISADSIQMESHLDSIMRVKVNSNMLIGG